MLVIICFIKDALIETNFLGVLFSPLMNLTSIPLTDVRSTLTVSVIHIDVEVSNSFITVNLSTISRISLSVHSW